MFCNPITRSSMCNKTAFGVKVMGFSDLSICTETFHPTDQTSIIRALDRHCDLSIPDSSLQFLLVSLCRMYSHHCSLALSMFSTLCWRRFIPSFVVHLVSNPVVILATESVYQVLRVLDRGISTQEPLQKPILPCTCLARWTSSKTGKK